MQQTSVAKWAAAEFGSAQLGDVRRTRRLVQMAAGAARLPSGKVSAVFDRDRDREGAYDLLESPHVTPAAVAGAMFAATMERARGEKVVYVVLDISQLTLTDENESKGFGVIGASNCPARGLIVMNALVVGLDGVPLGLIDQLYWLREVRQPGTNAEKTKRNTLRPFEEKQGAYFVRAAENARARLSEAKVVPWFIVDREGDCREILRALAELPCLLTIRGTRNRLLSSASDEKNVRESLLREPKLGVHHVEIARSGQRAARVATVELYAKAVELRFNSTPLLPLQTMKLHAVLVREVGTASGTPLDWLLYTNAPISSEKAALQIVEAYRARWRIEEFHRTWKKGDCNVESSQLRSFDALVKWATVLAAIAVRIERLKYLTRAFPDRPASVELEEIEIEALRIERRARATPGKKSKLPDVLTIGEATRWIAEMGGWMGLKTSGPPGSITISRGLEKLSIYVSAIQDVRAADRRKRAK